MTTFWGRLVNWLEARRAALSGAVLLVSGACVVVGWEINAVHDAVVGSGVIQVLILAAILDLSRTYSQTRKEAPEVEGLSPALRDSLAIMERPSGGADAVASIVALTGLNTLPLLRVLAA